MHAIVKGSYKKTSSLTEAALRQLGFKFIVNRGGSVVEFEVQQPCRFVLTVQDASGMSFRFPLISSTSIESVIHVKRMVGGERNEALLLRTAQTLAGALSAQVPALKWKGLGQIE